MCCLVAVGAAAGCPAGGSSLAYCGMANTVGRIAEALQAHGRGRSPTGPRQSGPDNRPQCAGQDPRKELILLVKTVAPARAAGCGTLSADVRQFRDKDAFARCTGTVPVPGGPGPPQARFASRKGRSRTRSRAALVLASTDVVLDQQPDQVCSTE